MSGYVVDYTNKFDLFWYTIWYNSVIQLKARIIAQLEYMFNATSPYYENVRGYSWWYDDFGAYRMGDNIDVIQ